MKLSKISTAPPKGLKKETIKKETNRIAKLIAEKQQLIYAERKKAVLIIFQGMDASGKDGATRKVFKYCSPSGIVAHAFKKPTKLEFAHDFLWRVHHLAPAKGQFVIYNRSHYEDILIQRVHQWIDEDQVNARIDAINAYERLLQKDNNTTILKFYMHISPERQLEKLQERIDDPSKNWKHNEGDWEQRKYWDQYMTCYEDTINRCNAIPWIVAPVDSRWYRDYYIATKVLEALEHLDISLPTIQQNQS